MIEYEEETSRGHSIGINTDFIYHSLVYVIHCFIIPSHQTTPRLIIFSLMFTFLLVMDGSLPTSLKHIISNAEYYGPSLFLLGKWYWYLIIPSGNNLAEFSVFYILAGI